MICMRATKSKNMTIKIGLNFHPFNVRTDILCMRDYCSSFHHPMCDMNIDLTVSEG